MLRIFAIKDVLAYQYYAICLKVKREFYNQAGITCNNHYFSQKQSLSGAAIAK